MRYIRYTPKDIEILTSCLLLASEGFTAIRNLVLGSYGLDKPDNRPLAAAPPEVPVRYVRNAKPGYCQAYFDHEWTTAGDKVQFVGVEKEGGRWVDVK